MNPLDQLREWLEDARDPNDPLFDAMAISTVGSDGRVSSRMVLLRGLDDGLVFYTNYESLKGKQLQDSPRAAALFYWRHRGRQVRVEGVIERVSEAMSDEYFAQRPREHQLSAWASDQSQHLESRELLEQRVQDYATRFEGEEIPRPHSWGGFRLRPDRIEFWEHRDNRLHDRVEYTRVNGEWDAQRLSP